MIHYAAAEVRWESGAQIALRAQRLDLANAPMQFQAEINLDSIIHTLMQLKPDVAEALNLKKDQRGVIITNLLVQ